MDIRSIISGAQFLTQRQGVVSLRTSLFSNRGREDCSGFPNKIGKIPIKLTNVWGGPTNSILLCVSSEKHVAVFKEDIILAEHPEFELKYRDILSGNETMSWVEKYEPMKGMSYLI